MAASGPGAANRMDGGRVLTRQDAPPSPHCSLHRQRTPGYRDTKMGTRHGNCLMIPPGGRDCPARRGALQNWGAGIRRRPVPAGRHPGALARHAPHGPCRRAAPGAGRLRRAASGVGGSCGQHPTGPPPPGRRRRVPMGYASAPPHWAPHVYGNPPPGAPPPGVGRPHRRLPRPRDSPRRHVARDPAEDARQGLPAPR